MSTFSNVITNTPFTTRATNSFFSGKISGEPILGDTSMIATLRALLAGRMGEDDYLASNFYCQSFEKRTIERHGEEALGNRLVTAYGASNSVNVVSFTGADGSPEKMLEIAEKYFVKQDSNWVRLTPVTDFFRKNFKCLCFSNEKIKSVVFLTANLNIRMLHQLQIAVISTMPWYFNPKNGDRLSEDERELLMSIQEKTPDHYLQCLEKMAAGYDFGEMFVRRSLDKIEAAYEKERMGEVTNSIERTMREVSQLQDRINDAYRRIDDLNIELLGLQTKLNRDGGKSILCDYFLANKLLHLDEVYNTEVTYHVNCYLSSFDEEQALTIIRNKYSDAYRKRGNLSEEDASMLMNALFIDQSIKLRFCAAYTLNIHGGFSAKEYYDFCGDDNDRMPNPHIQNYGCIGSNRQRTINDLLAKRQFIGVLEQSVASAKNINLLDGTVMNAFFSRLFNTYDKKWFEVDGVLMNLTEVLDYLKAGQEVTTGEEEKEGKENEQIS